MKNLTTTTTSNTESPESRNSHPIVTAHALTDRSQSSLHNNTSSTLGHLRPTQDVIDHILKHHNEHLRAEPTDAGTTEDDAPI
jgi:hypothetical protein